MTQGRRVYLNEQNKLSLGPGDYGKDERDVWWCRPPTSHMGDLEDHEVEEHDDGTITVSPSIHYPDEWHGYLRRGVWTELFSKN